LSYKITVLCAVLFLSGLIAGSVVEIKAQARDKQPLPAAHVSQTTSKKPEINVPFEEKLLGTILPEYEDPPDVTGGSILLDSPAQWAFVARQHDKVFLVVNNKKGPEFDEIRLLFQSPDLNTIGYIAEEGKGAGRKTILVLGNKTVAIQQGESIDLGETNDLVAMGVSELSPPLFSPDNKKLAYISFREDKNKEVVTVVEGDWADPAPATVKTGPEFDWVWEPVFSPDGNTLAYAAGEVEKRRKVDKPMCIVVGDKKGPKFDRVRYPTFNPAGTVVAYQARDVGFVAPDIAEIVVVGDKKGPKHTWVGHPVFSPDGTTVAYPVLQSAAFLPDKRKKQGFVVVGDKKGPKFDFVGEPVFSPDGASIAYTAKQDKKMFIVICDKKGPEFDEVEDPVFSPDGHTIAYQAKQGATAFIVAGDKRGLEFDEVGEPVFSPDGATVAYLARDAENKKMFIVIGEKRGPEFDAIFHPYFSSDGTRIAYGAKQGREYWWKVMDVR
jgi:WD40 repeat protein